MTILTNLSPAASYGDLITCTNNGGGLTSTLQNIQDGLGNNSAIQLSTTTLNVSGTFQVGGVTLATTGGAFVLPSLAADPGSPVNGMEYYNTVLGVIREYINGTWFSAGATTGFRYVTGTITTANILAMNGAAVAIPGLPAPGAGMMYVINSFALELTFNSVAYANGGVVFLQYGSGAATTANSATPIAGTGVTAAVVNSGSSDIGSTSGQTVGITSLNAANKQMFITNNTVTFITANSGATYYNSYSIIPVT